MSEMIKWLNNTPTDPYRLHYPWTYIIILQISMNVYHLHAITHVLILRAVLYAPVTMGMNWLLMEDIVMVGHLLIFFTWLITCDWLAEIDECTSSPCGHICTNTAGSFVCSCHNGYELNSNGRSCDGMYSVMTYCSRR